MCGRFSLVADLKTVTIRFDARSVVTQWKPRYNLAPGQAALSVVQENKERSIVNMTFGFIPHWAKQKATGYTMINAKAETVAEKPSYRESFRHKRCLVPADGYYEWLQTDSGKQPFRLTLKSGGLFAFAGIWDSWTDPEGKSRDTLAIITTEGNALTKKLHDRMPVILHEKDEEEWLNTTEFHEEKLHSLLKPFAANKMEMYPVSTLVNSWKNDNPDCIQPIDWQSTL